MKLGNIHTKKFLTSWKTNDDPSSGDYNLTLDTQIQDFFQLSVWKGDERIYTSGQWSGTKFGELPPMFDLTLNGKVAACLFRGTKSTSYTRLQMAHNGLLILFAWNQSSSLWEWLWDSSKERCLFYTVCGSNSFCDISSGQIKCNCLPGYELRDPTKVRNGCIRKTHLNCDADTFIRVAHMLITHTDNLSSTPVSLPWIIKRPECENICVTDCQCTAFAITHSLQSGSSSCLTWRGNIMDLQRYSDEGQDLFIKQEGKRKTNRKRTIIGLGVGIPTGIIFFSLAIYCFWKRRKQIRATARESRPTFRKERNVVLSESDIIENPPMDFGIIIEGTENFSETCEIGHGGFGKVYKGRLHDGEDIAVKKLLETSRQGSTEFKNEVKVIASLQHINLVRLRGWSVCNDAKVLVYEYLENGGTQNCKLNWHTRFAIIDGIAKGLGYMQEESRVKIIHRDLKPANILLDREMVPKISDFGLARICENTENEAITANSAGTFGYMSPEYAGDGVYSAKSDIYSFGVIVLEIISGKKNRTFYLSDPDGMNLLSYAWTNFTNGDWEMIVDDIVHDSSQSRQLLRCIQIGLLCVQQVAEDRPHMLSVVMMLGSEETQIPQPKPPGFFNGNGLKYHSFSTAETSTVNQQTVSDMLPR